MPRQSMLMPPKMPLVWKLNCLNCCSRFGAAQANSGASDACARAKNESLFAEATHRLTQRGGSSDVVSSPPSPQLTPDEAFDVDNAQRQLTRQKLDLKRQLQQLVTTVAELKQENAELKRRGASAVSLVDVDEIVF